MGILIELLGDLLVVILDLLWLRSSTTDEQLGCAAQFLRLLLIAAIIALIVLGIVWLNS